MQLLTEDKERAAGIEPATSSLGSWHSTAELRPPTRPGWSHEPRGIALPCQRTDWLWTSDCLHTFTTSTVVARGPWLGAA